MRISWQSSTELEWERASCAGAMWLDEHLPDESVVGSEDAGVIGYFSRHPVIDLDGLVNSTALARALETGRHRQALKAANITHIANFGSMGTRRAEFDANATRGRRSAEGNARSALGQRFAEVVPASVDASRRMKT